MKQLKPKKIFNQSSNETFNEARILNGNPNGIFNFNSTNHKWATELYKKMEARTWFPGQVNISKDKNNYLYLTPSEKRSYDLVLAQLIANDSIQTNQLMDRINSYITSPIVNACLSRQSSEESTHAYSYSVMAEDIAMDTDRIYNMHKHDDELALKNKAVESMYDSLVKEYKDIDLTESIHMFHKLHGNDIKLSDLEYFINNLKNDIIEKHTENITPTDEDLLVAFGANQILEELVFPGGFIVLLSLGHKMPATAEMIAEIQKDETLSHVQLFKNIFRTAVDESFDGVVPDSVSKKITEMILDMVTAEKRWTKYVTQGLLGFSDRAIDIFIEDQANNICSNLRLPLIFEKHKDNPLKKILNKTLKGGGTDSREAFFESNVASYSKGSVETDF